MRIFEAGLVATLFVCVLGIDAVADHRFTTLPNGWELSQPAGPMVATGTMPQGAIASPDGSQIVVTESGFNAPTSPSTRRALYI